MITIYLDRFELHYSGRIYPVGIGLSQYPTPLGRFKVLQKEASPLDYLEVGSRCIDFHRATYADKRFPTGSYRTLAIHGTPHPERIGTQFTLGCVAMRNDHIEGIFDSIKIRERVIITDDKEDLAELEHKRWVTWTEKLEPELLKIQDFIRLNRYELAIEYIDYIVDRCKAYRCPYWKLPGDSKDNYRIWANRTLEVLEKRRRPPLN